MTEGFLEEQLKRIRDLTEQVSRLRPLHDLREVKNRAADSDGRDRKSPSSGRRDMVRDSPRRRGR